MKVQTITALVSVASVGCWDPTLPSATQSEEGTAAAPARFVKVDPAPVDGVSPLARFGFELPIGTPLESLRLYQGELSEYHQQRITKADLPNTLLEREVAVMTWPDTVEDAGGVQQVLSQAQLPLDPGASYSWALLGQGPLLSFAVGQKQPIRWRRLWPAPGAGFWGYAAYCHESEGNMLGHDAGIPSVSAAALEMVFEPGSHRVTAQRGLGVLDVAQDECLHLQIADDPLPELLVPPVTVAGALLDPAPLQTKLGEPVLPVICEEGWQQLGPGCVRVEDDRITVGSPPAPALWVLHTAELRFHAVAQGAFTVRGFAPGQQQDLDFVAFLSDGQRHQGRVRVTMDSPRSHVIINEVLANPLGAEPAQEWLELYNDGSAAVELSGWVLSDGVGESVLPAQLLGAGEYLVITSEQYVSGGEDVSFAEGAIIVRVPSLGANGLSNSGEEVQLVSASGQVQSRFAARGTSTGGVSVARVTPEAPDGIETSFAMHGDPGASPGTANTF